MSPHATTSPATTSPELLDIANPDRTHWLELPAHRSSVRVARRTVDARLTGWRLPQELCEDAVLLVSELATNAVRHTLSARILCGVGLMGEGRVRLEVHDHGYGGGSGDMTGSRPGGEAEGGRGLFLVEQIAETWGICRSRLTGGNAVWANLRA
ncbi:MULTISPECIES: ATP-binding protein [Streptomyces]|uniref:ATP-binding protein n=1 Tax=Streptomyces griseoaurantiacus TaxID=68213 RepID=A0ABZ1V5U8_9ACTN|nr:MULTISPECIES: ATP-binding protein [Streptomyces]GHE37980.1 ATP-binding protein [Streptomyces griseoaurantiacus]MCF0090945.1 hypothetical protein [Streptomyces sp. MH192]MCF0103507.1 hypothetical protein [Streptomyces sp. MH191]MDX3088920.1 ATP-binding protein [Streptomyces sp. ME12-02E]MDX3334511.1 ATP-binding protein [Streptomyces sp. ME02-6978a]